jgi:hypothetical protein
MRRRRGLRTGRLLEEPFGTRPNDLPITAIATAIEIDLRGMFGDEDLPTIRRPVEHILLRAHAGLELFRVRHAAGMQKAGAGPAFRLWQCLGEGYSGRMRTAPRSAELAKAA